MRYCRFPKRYADFVARLRVPGGFALVAAFAYYSAPNANSLMAGLPVAAAGMLIRGWAAGHLAKNEKLATGGPFAHTRNPLYLGTVLVAAGLVIASRCWLLAALFAATFVLVYLPVIELEEQHLRKLFPEYAAYAAVVPMLWPRLKPGGGEGVFRWKLYLRNREYQALAGFLTGVLFLLGKAFV